MKDCNDHSEMNQTSCEKSKSELIDDSHCQKIMPNTLTKARTTAESDERKEIIQQSEEESDERKEDEERDGRCLSLMGEKIRREELIKSDRERFGVELTLLTKMTWGTKTKKVIRSTRVSLKATTIGATEFASIELIVVEKAFYASVILSTNAEIDIVSETESSGMQKTDLMISNRRSF